MKPRFLFLTVVLILTACASPTATPIPTITLSPTYTPSFTSTPFVLPEECKTRNPQNDPFLYELMGYGKDESCKLFTISPDKSLMAYVILDQRFQNDTFEADVVKVIYASDRAKREIYRNGAWKVSTLEWSSNGKLIISDIDMEGRGTVATYDANKSKITNLIEGQIQSWNPQRNAFYTTFRIMGVQGFYFSGYDAVSDKPFPKLDSIKINVGNNYGTIGFVRPPIWENNGRSLLLNMRTANTCYETGIGGGILLIAGPSSIELIDLSGDKPIQKTLKSSADIDYIITSFDEKTGPIFTESPYKTSPCN